MENNLSSGGHSHKTIHPINDIAKPKVPEFSETEHTAIPVRTPGTTVAAERASDLGAQETVQSDVQDKATPENAVANEPEKLSKFEQPELPATTPPKPQEKKTSLSRRKIIILAIIAGLLIVGGSVAAYLANQPSKTTNLSSVKPKTVGKPIPTTSNLSGMVINDSSVNDRPVTGIMIENSDAARPQSGLDQASVVFEAIAEGGITRFLALFQDNMPDYVGPVRSARPYYVQWCMSFDCALAHVGGSPDALDNIKSWGTKDLDQFSNSGPYWRTDSRYAPHNMYTSISGLNQLESSKGYNKPSYTPLVRKPDSASKTPNASSIDVNISSDDFNSHYDYDASSNSYKRSEGGVAHMVTNKAGNQAQLAPKSVVILITPYSLADSDGHSAYGATGTGEALVFQDGVMTHGNWHKADTKTSLSLTDDSSKPLSLNAGQTWFVALPGTDRLSYK